MSDTIKKTLDYDEWVAFASKNYDIIIEKYDDVVFDAVVYDGESGEERELSHTLEEAIEMCKGTSMEKSMRNAVMKAVYTGSNLEENIQKVMEEYYGLK